MSTVRVVKKVHYDVMLSSTFKDLKEHRTAILDAVHRVELFSPAMEFDSALPEDVITASLDKVHRSDAYVGIIGFRYGQIPESPQHNPNKISITELEYEKAELRDLPICMFVMSDKHLVTLGEVSDVGPEERPRLKAFRSRIAGRHIYAEFDSVEDLKVKALQSLTMLRERLDAQSGSITPAAAEKTSPQFLPLVAMPPFTPGHEFTGRVKELQSLDDWGISAKDPIFILEAIGGMGKSMLSWQWVNHRARQIRPDLAGIFWYSFYERGAEMKDCCAQCLAYLKQTPIEGLRDRRTPSLADELLQLLRQRPWLLVFDGLERVLRAYNRYDAAQVRDEEVEAFEDSKKASAHECIRPADADFLRTLSEAGPSKILISSRLMPAALLNNTGLPRPGVTHKLLSGLDPSDAEAMLRQLQIKGDSAEIRRYLDKNFGCHPLVVGVVGGLVRNYAPAPHDFDKWSEDADAGGSVNVAAMDLVQRRNHILKFAFDELDPDTRTLLARLALVSEAVDYETSTALNPRRPEAPEEVDRAYDWMPDYDERQKAYQRYLKAFESWQNSPAQSAAKQWLNSALKDLEFRGLLQWDHQNGKYDLHPVVRGYAVSSLTPDRREPVAKPIIDYFSSRPDIPGEDAKTMYDVRNSLQVARTLLHLGKFNEAVSSILNIANALFWNLEAFEEYLTLVRPLFPNGWAKQPRGIDGSHLAMLWTYVSIALRRLQGRSQARPIYERIVGLDIELDRGLGVLTNLRHLSRCGSLAYSSRVGDLLPTATSVLGDQETAALTHLWRMATALDIGDFVAAQRLWVEFDAIPRPETRAIYRPGEGEYWCAKLRLLRGTLDETLLAEAQTLANEANNRGAIRDLRQLRGEWMLSLGRYAEAAAAFEDHVNLTREVNLDSSVSEGRLALAEAKQGHRGQPLETAHRLSALENPPHLELAELYLEFGDPAEARRHIIPAYHSAWADGPPYVYWWELQRARAVLSALGDPEPQLPPFDLSKVEPFPFEAQLESYLERKKAEKEADEAKRQRSPTD